MAKPEFGDRRAAIRLTLPARVANDLDGLNKSLAQLAERMGHPSCATGCDILLLQQEREFVVNEAGELNPQPLPPGRGFREVALPSDPVPLKTVQVMVAERVTSDLEALQKAVAITVGKLGCRACCSGFDIEFRNELDLITINDKIEAQGFGRFR